MAPSESLEDVSARHLWPFFLTCTLVNNHHHHHHPALIKVMVRGNVYVPPGLPTTAAAWIHPCATTVSPAEAWLKAPLLARALILSKPAVR